MRNRKKWMGLLLAAVMVLQPICVQGAAAEGQSAAEVTSVQKANDTAGAGTSSLTAGAGIISTVGEVQVGNAALQIAESAGFNDNDTVVGFDEGNMTVGSGEGTDTEKDTDPQTVDEADAVSAAGDAGADNEADVVSSAENNVSDDETDTVSAVEDAADDETDTVSAAEDAVDGEAENISIAEDAVKEDEEVLLEDIGETETAAELTLTDVNPATGAAEMVLSGFHTEQEVIAVKISAWSLEDQSNLHTYTAAPQEDGTWQAAFRIAKHGYEPGTYHFSAEAVLEDGSTLALAEAEQDFIIKAAVSAWQSGAHYQLRVKGLQVPGGYSNARFWVISPKGTKKLYQATVSGRTAKAKVSTKDFKTYGTYTVKAYATDGAGRAVLLGKTSYKIIKPTADKLTVKTSQKKGKYVLYAKGVAATAGLKEVQAAVWSKQDQSDLVWYTMEKVADGTYKTTSTIKKHQYSLGTYQVHIYVKDVFGTSKKVLADSFQIKAQKAAIKISGGSTEKAYKVTASGMVVPAGFKTIKAAVWSTKSGKDDLVWYTMTAGSSAYKATVKISRHKTLGQYQVRIYAFRSNGMKVYLGKNTDINVTSQATATAKISKAKPSAGTFCSNWTVKNSLSGIKKVEVAVWSLSDQSNLCWYRAEKQSSGVYQVKVDISNHLIQTGTYRMHCYVTMGNGIRVKAGTRNYDFSAAGTEAAKQSWLFPGGVPTSESQMNQYLGTAHCRCRRADGSIRTINMTVHKKIAPLVEHIFEELLSVPGYYIQDLGCYEWRMTASGTGRMSNHAYALAIDVNADANPAVYWGYSPNPSDPRYNNSTVVSIFKKYGFYWGGDWDRDTYYDPMHFSFTDR